MKQPWQMIKQNLPHLRLTAPLGKQSMLRKSKLIVPYFFIDCILTNALRMRAKNVLLTHFSNRFPKTPQMATTGPADPTTPTVAVAFDHVTVSIGNLWKLSRYLPAIEQSFIDSEDPEDEIIPVEILPES
jgi:hypothetical protein